ncbi:MAG: phospholipase [Gemmatimonadaceae bacterium]|nr:phospholipase [Chitinophagaceae bacterium]
MIINNMKGLYTRFNKVQLLRGGREYFDCLVETIERTEQFIHLQYYIFDADDTGQRVADALKKAAERGVKVFLLVDGFASQQLPGEFIADLKKSGVHFRWFQPLLKGKGFYFGRRLHHKVVVADGVISLVAGLNVSNRYNDMPEHSAWLDWAVIAEGEVSAELYTICRMLWYKSSYSKQLAREKPEEIKPSGIKDICEVRVRRNDWVRRKNQVTRSYLEMFRDAKEEIIIMSSYFLPGKKLRKRMEQAARRGVRIRLILAGRSDIRIAKYAERYMYRWLINKKIKIFEYQPNIVHGKIGVCDKTMVTVGSYNFNNISAYASLELNLDIRNKPFAEDTHQKLVRIIETDCEEINETNAKVYQGFGQRIAQRVSYEVVRLMIFVFTFYFKQKE